jgi:PadR family transcriptional regulator, regulatory protein PadR
MQFSTILTKGMADLIILRILDKHGESYGYQLIERISDESKNLFAFQEGTLYPLLYKMERDGLVTSKRKTALSGKERRYYRMTDLGKKQLVSRSKEYKGFLQGLQSVFDWAVV